MAISSGESLCALGLLWALICQASALTWTNCGSATDSIKLKKLSVSPDTVQIPGLITVTASAILLANITGPVKVVVKVSKKTLVGYIHIPCEDDIGSCTYDDMCTLSPYTAACPTVFDQYNMPCKCPIQQGQIEVRDFPYTLGGYVPVPKFLISGTFKVNIVMSMHGQELGCYDVKLNMK